MALALGSTVMVALFAMYEGVLDASEQVRRVSAAGRSARMALGVIEDDLRSISPVPGSGLFMLAEEQDLGTGADGTVVLSMTTTATLDFSSELPHWGIQVVEYMLVDGVRGESLVRRERPFAGIVGDFEWLESVLLEDVDEVRVETWDASFNDYSTNLDMLEGLRLPKALRVTLSQSNEGGVRTYELVTPLPDVSQEGS